MAAIAYQPALDRRQARELVNKIARSHGYIATDILETMSPEIRLIVEEALRKKDDMIASSVSTLARNLYTSSARFIFELLQNADDNHYTQVKKDGLDPYISFNVYHDRLVMECNEDGFNEENLKAICDVGKSSKQGAQGYIGEKGIGFKSTFMAAWKVQIESGPFSFYFQHRKGDSGMGMVTPVWFEPELDIPIPRSLTRITLFFHQNEHDDDLKRRRNTLIKQLWDLQGTVLLFLRNIRCMKVKIFNQSGEFLKSREVTRENMNFEMMSHLITIEDDNGSIKMTRETFYVVSFPATNLAKNENRTYTEAEERAKAYSMAIVILAFPLQPTLKPIVEQQQLFAFMPIRKAGFNFLIHSDFVTQANREDIVTTSKRNIGLRDAIASAFAHGISTASRTLPSLRYTWMRYLPRKESLPLDQFWRDLVPLLQKKLFEVPILYSRNDLTKQYTMGKLGRLTEEQQDEKGQPLFPDLKSEKYISSIYDTEDLNILMEYGLKHLDMDDIIPRLKHLTATSAWHYKSFLFRDESWHSRVAVLIMQAWEDETKDWKRNIRQMSLLPLSSLDLTSLNLTLTVYFPRVANIQIPNDLGLKMISDAAVANLDCRKLYRALGVTTARPRFVRELIIQKNELCEKIGLDPEMSNQHFRYLYQMHPKETAELEKLVIFDHLKRAKKPLTEHVYMPREDKSFSPEVIFEPLINTENPEVDVSLIHSKYLQEPYPAIPANYDKGWITWLSDIMKIEDKILIFNKRNQLVNEEKEISEVWKWVAKVWPGKMVEHLQSCWHEVAGDMDLWVKDVYGTKLMRQIEFVCLDNARYSLETTFLPTPFLLSCCESLITSSQTLPFLKLENPVQENDSYKWVSFCQHFGIGMSDNLDFSLAVLLSIIYADITVKGPLTKVVVHLYLRMHVQCLSSEDREGAQKRVRNHFIENCEVLCSPGNDISIDSDWGPPENCVWEAPLHMSVVIPLKSIWEPAMEHLEIQDRESLEQFFRHTLLIRDLEARDIIEELSEMSKSHQAELSEATIDFNLVHELYWFLDEMCENLDVDILKVMKNEFEENALIYAPSNQSNKWFKTSECVWSSESAIVGKASLEQLYPNLSSLFVKTLGVPKLSYELVYKELVEIGSGNPEISYVKNLLITLTALISGSTDEKPKFGEDLAACRIFPVRTSRGNIELMSSLDDFAIIDRQPYANVLRDRIKVLDFNLSSVKSLMPLFEWAGLSNRRLSRQVIERSTIISDQCTLDKNASRDLAGKAKAFLSIAVHFDSFFASSGESAAFAKLCKIKVFTTHSLQSTLVIVQDGKEIITSIGSSEFNIDLTAHNEPKLYVPADDGARDVCISSRLPCELAAFLMESKISDVDPQIISIVSSLIHARPSSASRILEMNGVPELEISPIQIDIPDEEDDDNIQYNIETVRQSMEELGITPNQIDIPVEEHDGNIQYSSQIVAQDRKKLGSFSNYSYRTPYATPQPPTNGRRSPSLNSGSLGNDQYSEILIRVVHAARSLSFPAPNSVSELLTEKMESLKFYCGDSTEWRRRVGAAGELFVFEMLSRLSPKLPSFSTANWQSTIRRFANIHPEYSYMAPWVGIELSDIYYTDEAGVFTSILVEKGYLDKTWIGETPSYFIEVKTTMSTDLSTPFYMSKSQYKRMQKLSGSARLGSYERDIYILFRVYGLGTGEIGVMVYVDPEAAREKGVLTFEVESWNVTPTMTRDRTPSE